MGQRLKLRTPSLSERGQKHQIHMTCLLQP